MLQNTFYSKVIGSFLVGMACLSFSADLEAGWSTPVTISSTVSDLPDITVDRAGNAVAIWQGYDGSNYRIQTSSLPYGGTWSAPVTLSAEGGNAQSPEVRTDHSGNAVAVWSRYDGTSSVIQSSQLPFGGTWLAPVNISTPGANADSCMLAMDSSGSVGNAVAVWHRYNGSNFVIQAATLPSGGNWSAPANVSPSGQDALIPSVAVNSSGNSTFTCARFDGTVFNVRSATQLYSQSWGPNFNLSVPGDTVNQPSVTMDSNDNAMVAWGQYNGESYIIQTSLLPSGGSWSPAVTLSGLDAYAPVIVMDTAGNAAAIWIQFDGGSNYTLWGSSMPVNGSWTAPYAISPSGYDVGVADLVVDLAGNFTAIWDHNNGTDYKVQSARLPKNGSWSAPLDISTPGNLAYFPDVEVDSSGNAVSVWLEFNGETYVVKGATLPFGG